MSNKKRMIDCVDEAIKRYAENGDILRFISDVRLAAINAYSIDAVEVVHGRWIKTYTCHGERLWGYECDQCKKDSQRASNYCPNCGTKMDG